MKGNIELIEHEPSEDFDPYSPEFPKLGDKELNQLQKETNKIMNMLMNIHDHFYEN